MPKEQEIVAGIRSFLESDAQMDSPQLASLAEEYAALCEKANERLRRCEQYLRSGMRTAAIDLAEATPPILEVAAALDFPGADSWHEFCRRDKRFAVAKPIAVEIVSSLNESYVQEESLSAILSQYKHAVFRGALAEVIPLLRRLVTLDQDNVNTWRRDLKQFEHARLEQLAKDVQRAVAGEDMPALEALHNEVNSPDWLTRPNERLVANLERNVERIRTKMAHAKGKEIAEEAWDAYNARDYGRTADALRKWRRHMEEGHFSPDAQLAGTMEEVHEWYDIEEKKRAEEEDFNRALSALAEALDEGVSRADLERLMYAVGKHNRELPETLRLRSERALESARIAEKRARMLKIVVGAVVLIAIGVATFFIVSSALVQRVRAAWLRQIDAAAPDGRLVLIEKLEKEHPEIAGEAVFQKHKSDATTEVARIEEQHERFKKALDELVLLKSSDFQPDDRWRDLMKSAGELAQTDVEKDKVKEMAHAKKMRDAAIQRKIDEGFDALYDRAKAKIDVLDGWDPMKRDSEYGALLEKARQDFNKARSILKASGGRKDQLRLLRPRISGCERKLAKATKDLRAQKELIRKIHGDLPQLAEYQRLLRSFVGRFPGHPETARFEKALADCDLGGDLERGRQWTAEPDAAMDVKAQMFLGSPAGAKSMWRGSLERLRRQFEMTRDVQQIKQSIHLLKDNWRFYNLCCLKYTDPKTKKRMLYYYVDDPEKVSEMKGAGRTAITYAISVFVEADEPEEMKFMLAHEISPDREDRLAPHCKWFRGAFRKIINAKPENCELVLLQSVKTLWADQEIDPVVKVILMQTLLDGARKITLDNGPEIDRLLESLASENTNVFWMNPKPDSVTRLAKQETKRNLAAMTGIGSLGLRTTLMGRIHRESLSRDARYIGNVKSVGGKPHTDLDNIGEPEVWIVKAGADGVPAVHIVAAADANGKLEILPSAKEDLYPGQPLFAPADEKRTADIVKDIYANQPARMIEQIAWPACWPVNARNPK